MHPINYVNYDQIKSDNVKQIVRAERNNRHISDSHSDLSPLPHIALGVSIIFLIPGLHTIPEQARARRALRFCTVISMESILDTGRRLAPARSGRRGWRRRLGFCVFRFLLAQLANAMCDLRSAITRDDADAGVLPL